MPERLRAQVAHRIPGRVRLRLETDAADRQSLETLADAIAAMPGVRKVEIRPETGSVLIRHAGALETILRDCADIGLSVGKPPPQAPLDPVGDMGRNLFMADMAVRQASKGQIDLWNAAFLVVLAIGLLQLGRGRIAGPALTVLGQAATIAMTRPYQLPDSTRR